MQSATLQPTSKTIRAVLPTHRKPLAQTPPEGYMTSEEFRKRAAMQVSTMFDYACTDGQRQVIMQAQQAVSRGESLSNEEVKQAVELCLSEN